VTRVFNVNADAEEGGRRLAMPLEDEITNKFGPKTDGPKERYTNAYVWYRRVDVDVVGTVRWLAGWYCERAVNN